MFDIFTTDIKNTRFILMISMMGAILLLAGGIYGLLFVNVDLEAKAIAFGVIATVVGSFINGFGQAVTSFFAEKKEQDVVNAEIKKIEAVAVVDAEKLEATKGIP